MSFMALLGGVEDVELAESESSCAEDNDDTLGTLTVLSISTPMSLSFNVGELASC